MIKILKKHNIYEVWNEWLATSVYFEGCKPTQQDLIELCKKEKWGEEGSIKDYIRDYIHVYKEKKVYARNNDTKEVLVDNPNVEKPKKKCSYCHGCGTKSDDSYDIFSCPWCDGTGYV